MPQFYGSGWSVEVNATTMSTYHAGTAVFYTWLYQKADLQIAATGSEWEDEKYIQIHTIYMFLMRADIPPYKRGRERSWNCQLLFTSIRTPPWVSYLPFLTVVKPENL